MFSWNSSIRFSLLQCRSSRVEVQPAGSEKDSKSSLGVVLVFPWNGSLRFSLLQCRSSRTEVHPAGSEGGSWSAQLKSSDKSASSSCYSDSRSFQMWDISWYWIRSRGVVCQRTLYIGLTWKSSQIRKEKVFKTVHIWLEKVQDPKSFTFLYQLFKLGSLLSLATNLSTKSKLALVILWRL